MRALSAVVAWSLANRPLVLIASLLFIIAGVRAALSLPIDAVPDVTNVQVQVITSAPALSPVEIEKYVTVPVERALAGIPHTTELRSVSKYGLSLVTIVFRDGTDIYFARQLVNERMREVSDAVPARYGRPEVGPITSGLGEILQFTVENPRLTLMQLEELLMWEIRPRLRTVPGVIEVNSFGGEDRQYQVLLDPRRLQAAGISVADVARALERSNANAGGGYIEHNREHIVIGSDGLVHDLDDLRSVVIGATPQGVPITIATVGDVRFAPRLRRGAASKDAHGEVVVGVAMMLMGENSRTVTAALKRRIADILPSLPEGTRVTPFYDRSALVDRTIHTVGTNLLEGAVLVITVLLLLLGDLRAGLVVATTIPLALLFAVLVMNATGLSGNLMSLGAIDFGLIVDGAVIIVENAVRRLSERGPGLSEAERLSTIHDSTVEVRAASVFGELTIAIVYMPLLALIGMEGKLFRPMAATVLLALLGAFLLSLTLVPVLTSYLVRPQAEHRETWLLRKVHALYTPLLTRALQRRGLTLTFAIGLLAVGVVLFMRIGAEFVPQLDEGDLLLEVRRLPGVALSESVAEDQRIQRAALTIPEVASAVNKTGAPSLATDPMGMEQSDVYLSLRPRKTWRQGLTKEALGEEIAHAVERAVPEVGLSVSQPIQMRTNELVAGIRSDGALLLYGDDIDKLRTLADSAGRELAQVPGAVDVRVEQVAGLRYLRVLPDRAKLARYGFTIDDVNQLTETLAVGHAVGEVLEGERRFGITIKLDHGFAGDLAPLLALPLRSLSGQMVPLGDVATLQFVNGPAQVSRDDQSRRISVEFNVRGRDLSSTIEEARARVAKVLALPDGYRAHWGGQFEHYEEARTRLAFVVPLALLSILFLLWMALGSVRAALMIFSAVPFACVGGVLALWARDIPFSISAGVGFIALSGVAVLNGLVLVSFAHERERHGIDHVSAIKEACALRMRPVVMTAMVAALGFIPMALSTTPGSEIQRPLATVVIGGLLSATSLTLLVLPAIYSWFTSPAARPLPRA
ncbi:MAG TPA: CusA/CzcA family heavy metal efflux RND transporter [Polyangiales bacterium]